jgi:PKD repeat protein
MSVTKVRWTLLVGCAALVCVAVMLSGCARFDGVVDFTADPTSGKAPLSVRFTPSVGGDARRYVWSFGDGETSTERSPEHTYVDPGTYTVILMVIPRRGEPESAIKIDCITVRSGFGATPAPVIVQDDEFDIPGSLPSFPSPWSSFTVYVLDVLENDAPGDGGGELTIVGVRSPWSDTYEDDCETNSGSFAWVNLERTAIEYEYLGGSTDSFYYLATDGLTTAEGEVHIEWWPIPGHRRLGGDREDPGSERDTR